MVVDARKVDFQVEPPYANSGLNNKREKSPCKLVSTHYTQNTDAFHIIALLWPKILFVARRHFPTLIFFFLEGEVLCTYSQICELSWHS